MDTRRAEGWPAHATGQTFYAFERMGRWGATGVRRAAATADLFSPFFSGAFITAASSQSGGDWVLERLHHRLMSELEPALRDAPFADAWPPQRPRLAGAYAAAGSVRAVTTGCSSCAREAPACARTRSGRRRATGWPGTLRCTSTCVERAAGTSIEEYIDVAALRRLLSGGQPPDTSALRALSAVWWFHGLD